MLLIHFFRTVNFIFSIILFLLPNQNLSYAQASGPIISNTKSWCSPNSWPNNQTPTAGSNVMIPAGLEIILDCNPPPIGNLHIHGILKVAPQKAVKLSAYSIHLIVSAIWSKQRSISRQGRSRATFRPTFCDFQ